MTRLAQHCDQPMKPLENLFDLLSGVDAVVQLQDALTSSIAAEFTAPTTPLPPSLKEQVEKPFAVHSPLPTDSSESVPAEVSKKTTTESPPSVAPIKKSLRRGRLQEVLLRLEASERFGVFHPQSIKVSPPPEEPKPVAPPQESKTVVEEPPVSSSLVLQQQLAIEAVTSKVDELSNQLSVSQKKIYHLESQVYEPTELINPLLPLITELLKGKITEVSVTREEIFHLVVPIIDRVICERTVQDRKSMSQALSTLIPEAISYHIQKFPDEIANAIGPTMGRAIKEQIRLERDAMVDALYPVIGNTIAKYMGEVVRTINEKVEHVLSVEGLQRKLRAKMQGVSEAELIMQEALPFQVSAIFLIHKASGLIIAEVQQTGEERLESEMVAGMLTAIRSFANDCFAKGENSNNVELSEVEYDSFKIILEVAGYCYLAVVSRGEVPRQFIDKVRTLLIKIIEQYDRAIQNFDGNSEHVPKPIPALLESLMIAANQERRKGHSSHTLLTLMGIGLLLALAFGTWGMIASYQERTVLETFDNTPELAIYRLDAQAQGNRLTLTGKLPNHRLREAAEMIALNTFPGLEIDNQIVAADIPPDPVQTQGEVQRITDIFNQHENTYLTTHYSNRKVFVQGQVNPPENASTISKAFEVVPGVNSLVVAIEQPLDAIKTTMAQRIYFELGSAQLQLAEMERKITLLQPILQQYPEIKLKIIGHSDTIGQPEFNQKLALQRALAVKQALLEHGIDETRFFTEGIGTPPPDLMEGSPDDALSRCVRFEKWDSEQITDKPSEKAIN